MSREAANAWAIQRVDQTTEPMQFVSDLRDVATPNSGLRRLTDPVIAAELIAIETRLRLEAIFEKDSGPPVVLHLWWCRLDLCRGDGQEHRCPTARHDGGDRGRHR
jgi:hypothetical protein